MRTKPTEEELIYLNEIGLDPEIYLPNEEAPGPMIRKDGDSVYKQIEGFCDVGPVIDVCVDPMPIIKHITLECVRTTSEKNFKELVEELVGRKETL